LAPRLGPKHFWEKKTSKTKKNMRLKFKYNFKLELELRFVMRCQNAFGIESTSKAFGKKKTPQNKKKP